MLLLEVQGQVLSHRENSGSPLMRLGSRSSGDDEPEGAAAGAAAVVVGPAAAVVPLMAGEGPETCPAARAASAHRTRYRQEVFIAPI